MEKSFTLIFIAFCFWGLAGCSSSKIESPPPQLPQQQQATPSQILVSEKKQTSYGAGTDHADQNIEYQTITNTEYKFSFQIPNDWTVQSRSSRNAITYQSPNQHATVTEYGYPQSDPTESLFIQNQWRFNIPDKSKMSYFADGTKGSWIWISESWIENGKVNYALVYLNGTVINLIKFQYSSEEKFQWDSIVTHAVDFFVPSSTPS